MKTCMYLLCALLLGGIFLTSESCNKINELREVDFEASYDADLEVETYSRDINGDFFATATIDPSSNENFKKYQDKIKEINIIGITGVMVYLNTDFTLNAYLSIYSENHEAFWSVSNFPVYEGAILTLGNEDNQWDHVKKIANEKVPYKVIISGNTSEENLEYIIKVTIKYKVKAKK